MKLRTFVLCLAFVFSAPVFAHPDHQPVQMPKEFDGLKQLVGTWEGTSTKPMGQSGENTVTATYELTSGGTAIMERLMPGTPHEMITVYHKDGKTIGMTHYCAMGNQPHMMLKNYDGKTMAFEMTKPMGVSSMKEPHMHALTLTMMDSDTLKADWTNYENGKEKAVVTFNFKRKK